MEAYMQVLIFLSLFTFGSTFAQGYVSKAQSLYGTTDHEWQSVPRYKNSYLGTGLARSRWDRIEYMHPLNRTNPMTTSSCVRYELNRTLYHGDLKIRFRSTGRRVAGDTCEGRACGTSPGLHVFTYVPRLGHMLLATEKLRNRDQVRTIKKSLRDLSFEDRRYGVSEVTLCRSGAGHARDNLEVLSLEFTR